MLRIALNAPCVHADEELYVQLAFDEIERYGQLQVEVVSAGVAHLASIIGFGTSPEAKANGEA
jgi:hypothetical protein